VAVKGGNGVFEASDRGVLGAAVDGVPVVLHAHQGCRGTDGRRSWSKVASHDGVLRFRNAPDSPISVRRRLRPPRRQ
jgi:hypothetical protein